MIVSGDADGITFTSVSGRAPQVCFVLRSNSFSVVETSDADWLLSPGIDET
jgi:hypothetical protein